jgi:hypothetical protein
MMLTQVGVNPLHSTTYVWAQRSSLVDQTYNLAIDMSSRLAILIALHYYKSSKKEVAAVSVHMKAMKRLVSSVLAAAVLSTYVSAEISKEDEKFWNRFLQYDSSMSMPPTPPTPTPPPPTPPLIACDVDVVLGCQTADGRPCSEVVATPDCSETLIYDISLSNVGTNDMAITVVDFDCNGVSESLLAAVPINPLVPAQSTSLTVERVIDTCAESQFLCIVNVEANPPMGLMCQDTDQITVNVPPPPPTPPTPTPPPPTPPTPTPPPPTPPTPTPPPPTPPTPTAPPPTPPTPTAPPPTPPTPTPPPPTPPTPTPPVACDVNVVIDCTTDDGAPCDSLVSPDGACATGAPILMVSFSLTECLCVDSANSQEDEAACQDVRPIAADATLKVDCISVDDGTVLIVEPPVVTGNDRFSVTSPGGGNLPEKMECTYSEPDTGSKLQINVIDTSGNVSLNLEDKFGSMQLKSCDDLTCIESLNYAITITNIGTTPMDITVVDFTFNGETESVLSDVPVNPLPVGENTSFDEVRLADICAGGDFVGGVMVEANPPTGDMCQDMDSYEFMVTPPPPTPPTGPPPTPAPTTQCLLNLDLECKVTAGFYLGQSCETPGIGIQPCFQRPTGATMLFRGGDCAQSDNRQFLKFTCTDTEFGPPSRVDGDRAYIVVTDVENKGLIYHQDFVTVGSNYYLRTPPGETRFVADQRIMIYKNEDTADPTNLLQTVQYHSSCSSNLELKNRFGASQLVEFQNQLQGNVTCFASAQFDLAIVIPIDIEGTSATLTKLTALTNFQGFVDLTDQVAGMEIVPGGTVTVNLPVLFDLTERRRYTILMQITATANPSGKVCTGTDFKSFLAGHPLPESVPTATPTESPTISPAPTTDALTTACTVEANIVCESLTEGLRVLQDCSQISDPKNVTCTSNLQANGLSFKYLGGDGLPDRIYVEVTATRDGVVFSDVVELNDVFRADGDYRGLAMYEIFMVGDGDSKGDLIQKLDINVNCEGTDNTLTLGTTIGPFELIGFLNGLGYFSSIVPIRIQYYVKNGTPLPMIAESVDITSDFDSGTSSPLTGEVTVAGSKTVKVFEEIQMVDIGAKFNDGTSLMFSMTANGRGERSGGACSDTVDYTF